jgi:hypothetical protein
VRIQHNEYSTLAPLWQKIRDVVAGEEVVKAKRTQYLPMLTSQSEAADEYARSSYENYLARAVFYDAASRTMMGLSGALLRKPPTLDGVPETESSYITDSIGIDYQPLDALAQDCIGDACTVGRWALLVDKSADAESRPYVVRFRAEDVVWWAEGEVNGRIVPIAIAVMQTYEEPKAGDRIGYETETKPELLMLRLGTVPKYAAKVPGFEGFAGAGSEDVVYWQERWRARASQVGVPSSGITADAMDLVRVVVPTKNGGRFWNEIPCDVVNAVGGVRLKTEKPPMLALANILLAHYRGSADLEWGRHMTAIPQPWASGFGLKDGERLIVGSGYAWVTDMPGAQVGYLEFSGAGLGHIAEGQRDKEKQMAAVGARMLEEQPIAAEAMGTVRLRQSGERSVLATIAESVSTSITRAVQRYLAWLSPAFDTPEAMAAVAYQLNADLDASRMDPAELTAMTQALQSGTMSWETFAHNMRRGEMYAPGVTDDEERERIQQGAPGRSRTDELTRLQTDVREQRLTVETYLTQIQALGMLPGVDVAAELQAIQDEKDMAVERQMQAFIDRAGFGGGGPPQPPPAQGDAEEDEPEPEAAEEDEEPAAT